MERLGFDVLWSREGYIVDYTRSSRYAVYHGHLTRRGCGVPSWGVDDAKTDMLYNFHCELTHNNTSIQRVVQIKCRSLALAIQ